MNSALLTDPVVLICAGIIVIGLAAFFWAVGKWRRLGAPVLDDTAPIEDLIPSDPSPLPEIDIRPPEMPFRQAAPAAAPAPAVSQEVAERLETMTQRLSEMQTVLMKQSAAAPGGPAGAPGGVGQGFSPETIEKLLKIIGNVIQQVDILQKSLNLTK